MSVPHFRRNRHLRHGLLEYASYRQLSLRSARSMGRVSGLCPQLTVGQRPGMARYAPAKPRCGGRESVRFLP